MVNFILGAMLGATIGMFFMAAIVAGRETN